MNLISVAANHDVSVNKSRLNRLRAFGHAAAEKMFRQGLRSIISVPANSANRPRPVNLTHGLALRGKI